MTDAKLLQVFCEQKGITATAKLLEISEGEVRKKLSAHIIPDKTAGFKSGSTMARDSGLEPTAFFDLLEELGYLDRTTGKQSLTPKAIEQGAKLFSKEDPSTDYQFSPWLAWPTSMEKALPGEIWNHAKKDEGKPANAYSYSTSTIRLLTRLQQAGETIKGILRSLEQIVKDPEQLTTESKANDMSDESDLLDLEDAPAPPPQGGQDLRELLPPIGQLDDAQLRAIRAPRESALLVHGPPGSGKTVIALYRAWSLQKVKSKFDLFVYGKVLFSYLKKSLIHLGIITEDEDDEDRVPKTFHAWFRQYYRSRFGENPPVVDSNHPNLKFEYVWDEISEKFRSHGFTAEFDQLIIDEGQDLPLDFYTFAPWMSKSITVFADDNQALFQNNTTLKKLRIALTRFNPEEIRLSENHRNSIEVAQFANLFETKGIGTGTPKLPGRHGSKPQLVKIPAETNQYKYVANYVRNNPQQSVGIFAPTGKVVEAWNEGLKGQGIGEKTQFYHYKAKVPPPDFQKPGAICVTFHSAKGLEFDAVFVVGIDKWNAQKVQHKMLLFVACSRPRSLLTIIYEDMPPILERNLPENPEGYVDQREYHGKDVEDIF
jgi:hypothetical protein